MERIDDKLLDSMANNMLNGLEQQIINLQSELNSDIMGLTHKQMRRMFGAMVSYPDLPEQKILTEREKIIISKLLLLQQARVSYEINLIAELNNEQQNASKEAENSKGE